MTAFEYLKFCGLFFPLPMSVERSCAKPTHSEVKRWLKMRAVYINGQAPNVNDEITFPVTELIFFPKGRRRCQYL